MATQSSHEYIVYPESADLPAIMSILCTPTVISVPELKAETLHKIDAVHYDFETTFIGSGSIAMQHRKSDHFTENARSTLMKDHEISPEFMASLRLISNRTTVSGFVPFM